MTYEILGTVTDFLTSLLDACCMLTGILRVKENEMHLVSQVFFLFQWVLSSIMWFFQRKIPFQFLAVTLSVITRLVFRCVLLSCILLKADKSMGSSRRTFLFKYFWIWKLALSVICFQSSEVCIKITNKSMQLITTWQKWG